MTELAVPWAHALPLLGYFWGIDPIFLGGLALDATVLAILLNIFTNEPMDPDSAFIFSSVAAIAIGIFTMRMDHSFGLIGILAVLILAPVAIGIAVSTFYGAEIKRSLLVGVSFVVAHFVIFFTISFAFGK